MEKTDSVFQRRRPFATVFRTRDKKVRLFVFNQNSDLHLKPFLINRHRSLSFFYRYYPTSESLFVNDADYTLNIPNSHESGHYASELAVGLAWPAMRVETQLHARPLPGSNFAVKQPELRARRLALQLLISDGPKWNCSTGKVSHGAAFLYLYSTRWNAFFATANVNYG